MPLGPTWMHTIGLGNQCS